MQPSRMPITVLAAPCPSPPAHAQEFPTQPICMMTPYAPGGGGEISTPLVALEMLEQPVAVGNRGLTGSSRARSVTDLTALTPGNRNSGRLPRDTSRAESAALIKSDLQKWQRVVRKNEVTAE